MTFCIEGEWSGYRSSQRRVVHREYSSSATFIQQVRSLGFIRFTDGTTLDLSVSEAPRRARQPEIKGYTSLIRDCIAAGVKSVDALQAKEKAGVPS